MGYGLEGDITDVETNLIAQQYLVSALQEGNYGEGLYNTVVALGKNIPIINQTGISPARGYYYYEDDIAVTAKPSTPFWDWDFFGIPLWVIIIFVLFGVFIPVFSGKSGSNHGGGRSGGGGSSGKW